MVLLFTTNAPPMKRRGDLADVEIVADVRCFRVFDQKDLALRVESRIDVNAFATLKHAERDLGLVVDVWKMCPGTTRPEPSCRPI